MAKYSISTYSAQYYDRWNTFVNKSSNGTLFHRLDFLAYHKNKFTEGENHLMVLKGEALFAVMPLFVETDKTSGKKIARSPYGGSFGGLVLPTGAGLKQYRLVIDLIKNYLTEEGIHQLFLTQAPHVYGVESNDYLDFCLLMNGATVIKKDLFHIRSLNKTNNPEAIAAGYQGRARTTLKKVADDFDFNPKGDPQTFYRLLSEDKKRHNSVATHTLEELEWLIERFPNEMIIHIAEHKESGACAGILYMRPKENVLMTFYIAQEDKALGQNGPTFLIDKGMHWAQSQGISYFDFGGSTYGYTIENSGVSEFKESFGALGYSRTTYLLQFDN